MGTETARIDHPWKKHMGMEQEYARVIYQHFVCVIWEV